MPRTGITQKDIDAASNYKMSRDGTGTPLGEMDRDELMYWCKSYHEMYCSSVTDVTTTLALSHRRLSILESLRELLISAQDAKNLPSIADGLAALQRAQFRIEQSGESGAEKVAA